jgi:Putative zinc-finger
MSNEDQNDPDSSDDREDDREMDALLRQSLGGAFPDAELSPACLDVEALAAWSDGALSRAELRAVESHVSGCDRCQAMAAAFSRADPSLSPAATVDEARTQVSLWRRWRLGWLAPIAATATALAVWVAVPAPRSNNAPKTEVAEAETAVDATQAPVSATQLRGEPESRSQANGALREAEQKAEVRDLAVAAQASADSASTIRDAPSAKADAKVEIPAAAREAPSVAQPPTGLAEAVARIGKTVEADGKDDAARLEDGVRLKNDNGRSDALSRSEASERLGQTTSTEVPGAGSRPPSELARQRRASSASEAGATLGAESLGAAPSADARVLEVSAPDGQHRWRLLGGTAVQHSATAGREWSAAAIPEGAGAAVLAGHAPGGRTCWLVGQRGTVLVTIDGTTFRAVMGPAATDIRTVRAEDARRATVVTSDGRTFTTTDGGARWVQP